MNHNRDDIIKDWRSHHDDITERFYVLKTMSKEDFLAEHRDIQFDLEDDLEANGHEPLNEVLHTNMRAGTAVRTRGRTLKTHL